MAKKRKPKKCVREGNFYRCEQAPKGQFDKRSFRTIIRGKNRIIIGCRSGKWDSKRKRCKVGTRAQSILKPIK